MDEKKALVQRARRIFCNRRHARRGCGKTFSVYLPHVFVRLRITASTAWSFLSFIRNGDSLEKAYRRFESWISLSLASFIRFWVRFKRNLSSLRESIWRKARADLRESKADTTETITHWEYLRGEGGRAPPEVFQEAFQKSFV
ncbi:MAG: hypothetical protein JNM63_12655 [Spirochaetia bacterium]|nr:hypothetical protein [Spirochaetia bacterium]